MMTTKNRMIRRGQGPRTGWWALVLGLMVAVLLPACTSSLDAPGLPIPANSAQRKASGELGPGDVVSIVFPGAPELNLNQKIRADGRLSLPMVGDIRVAGKTPASLQSELKRRYSSQLQDSDVLVSVVSVAAAVYVSGEVLNPGKIPLERPLTAFEAIMESGGLAPTADAKKVWVVRTDGGQHKRYNLDMTETLGGSSKAFYLQASDVVYVGQRMW